MYLSESYLMYMQNTWYQAEETSLLQSTIIAISINGDEEHHKKTLILALRFQEYLKYTLVGTAIELYELILKINGIYMVGNIYISKIQLPQYINIANIYTANTIFCDIIYTQVQEV